MAKKRYELQTRDRDDTAFEEGGWGAAFLLLLFFSPLVAFLGAMRWNIPRKLDRDLEFIFCWIIDAFLFFLVAYPFYLTAKNTFFKRVLERFSEGAFTVLRVLGILAAIAFVLASFVAFHYLISELLSWLF